MNKAVAGGFRRDDPTKMQREAEAQVFTQSARVLARATLHNTHNIYLEMCVSVCVCSRSRARARVIGECLCVFFRQSDTNTTGKNEKANSKPANHRRLVAKWVNMPSLPSKKKTKNFIK